MNSPTVIVRGVCQFCGWKGEDDGKRSYAGDEHAWLTSRRTVCNLPACQHQWLLMPRRMEREMWDHARALRNARRKGQRKRGKRWTR